MELKVNMSNMAFLLWFQLLTCSSLISIVQGSTLSNRTQNDVLKEENTKLKNILNSLCTESGKIQRQKNMVAFTVILDKGITLGENQVVPYNKVITNIGDGYDILCHHFVTPVDGVYSLSASMMGNPKNGIHLQLVKNGTELVRLWTQSGRHELSSHTINVYLNKNDKIWVRRKKGSGTDLYGAENYNVFSGALLYAISL